MQTITVLNHQGILSRRTVFVKAPSRIKKFKELCADLPLPPQPILTRWGTWIDAAVYYSNNFDAVKAVINSLETEDAASIRISQELFNKQGIAHQLANIQCNFSILPKAITKLESQGLTLSQSLDVLAEVKAAISNSGGQIGQKIQSKLEFVLRNNPGLSKMKEIAKVQNGEEAEMEVEMAPKQLAVMKYAPMVNCDVERSFSIYKNILTDNRARFTEDNLEMYIVCNYETRE